jgi:hypothetical protein
MKKALVLLLTVIFIQQITAQNNEKANRPTHENEVSIGISAGAVLFWGDGSDNVTLPFGKYFDKVENELSLDVFYETRIRPWIGVQTLLLKGNANGHREFWNHGGPANFRFEAEFYQFNMQANVYPLGFFEQRKQSRIQPFASVGLGAVAYRTAKYHLLTDELLNYYGYDDANLTSGNFIMDIIVPFGFGSDVILNRNWSVRVQNSFVYVTSDKFDGHIGRGTDINDMYTYTTLGFKYTFGKKRDMDPPMYDLRLVQNNNEKATEPLPKDENEPVEVTVKTEIIITTDSEVAPDVEIRTESSEHPGITIKPEYEVTVEKIAKTEITEIKQDPVVKDPVVKDPVVKTSDFSDAVTDTQLPDPDAEKLLKDNVEFRVQVFASNRSGRTSQSIANLLHIGHYNINREVNNDLYKFTIGSFKTHEEARQLRDELRKSKVPDAFIVYYVNGVRVKSIQEIYR